MWRLRSAAARCPGLFCCTLLLFSVLFATGPSAAGTAVDSAGRGTRQAAAKPAVKKAAPAKRTATRRAVRKSAPQEVKAAITMDLRHKRVLFQQNADRPVAPASLTKILSMFVILDEVKARGLSLDSMVTISHKAASTGGSCMNLYTGERVRLRDLLRGMAVASGNDASVAACQFVAGSEDRFVQMMNRKARQIGMKNSVFKNVHGLPAKGQRTTARDMLTLTSRYLTAHPEALEQYHSRRYLEFHGYTPNTNPLLGLTRGVDGLKTGYVDASGYNLITTAKRGDTRLINVLLGAPNKAVRLHVASRMVETGFDAAEALSAREAAAKAPKPKRGGKKNSAAPAAKSTKDKKDAGTGKAAGSARAEKSSRGQASFAREALP